MPKAPPHTPLAPYRHRLTGETVHAARWTSGTSVSGVSGEVRLLSPVPGQHAILMERSKIRNGTRGRHPIAHVPPFVFLPTGERAEVAEGDWVIATDPAAHHRSLGRDHAGFTSTYSKVEVKP